MCVINEKYKDRLFSFLYGQEENKEWTLDLYNAVNGTEYNDLLEKCRSLKEYSWLIEEIRKNCRTMEIEQAVDKAIADMPGDYMLKEFLQIHRKEVRKMLLTEYNEAETMELFKEDGRAEGRVEGRAEEREKIFRLLLKMNEAGDVVDFQKLSSDPEELERQFRKYGI